MPSALMESALRTVVNLSVTGSVAIAAILLLRLVLQRAPRRFSYALWSVAAFRLLCPVSFSAVFSLFSLKLFSQAALRGDRQDVLDYMPAASPVPLQPAATPVPAGDWPAAVQAPGSGSSEWLVTMLFALWMTGIAVMLLYGVFSYLKVRRQVSGSVRQEGNIFATDRIATPFVLGFFRPRIFLPFRLPEQERSPILAHERCHIRSGDHLVKPLAYLVLAIHWFNPLVWLAFSLMLRDMEMRCDEAVLQTYGASIKQAYSRSLLALATHRRLAMASPLAFGESHVKARIQNILNFKKPRAWLALAVLLVCVAAIVVIAANPTPRPEEIAPEAYSALDAAVRQAVIAHYAPVDYPGQISAEAHTILKAVASDDQVTVYAFVLYQRYTIGTGGIEVGGGNHMPTVLTFRKTGDRYGELLEYWTPRDGAQYGPSMRHKFPEDIVGQAMDPQKYKHHIRLCDDQALATYESELNPPHILAGSKDRVDAFLQLAQEIGFALPKTYPDDTCYNVTPPGVSEQTGCLVFKYDKSCEAFLLLDGQIYPLGTGFGGYGLTDLQLCDFDRNGHLDLMYSYSGGSGIHHVALGHFNLTSRTETKLGYAASLGGTQLSELYLVPLLPDRVIVYAADIAIADGNFAHITLHRQDKLAEITADGGNLVVTPLE